MVTFTNICNNGNPNVLEVLNSALANHCCAFPDGMIKRHKDFLCVAAGNTFGTGATREYVGKNQLSEAFLNRFIRIEVLYDKNLEIALFGFIASKVQAIRHKLANERVVISMRNISNVVKLISLGYSESEAIDLAVISQISPNLQKLAK